MGDSKKFDLQGLISSVKSMINPESNTPKVNPDDAIGMKIVELSTLIQQLISAQAEHNRELTRANKLLNDLFKDIEALRNPPSSDTEKPPSDSTSS